MYRIDWDAENNLAVLANENAFISNEIRPVFSDELKNVGFDRYISFEESETVPLLWAIRYQYYYRGKAVARLVDNGCIKAPSIEILDESFVGTRLSLIDIDLWFDKNRKLMDQLVQDTLLRIYRVYMEWKDRVDYIDVAYSGGKDSMVLLDLVKRVLPHDSFFVAWIDSGMEYMQSVEIVRHEMERCKKQGIQFLANHPILEPLEAWAKIGPPSFNNRWCCSVLRSVPNTIQLKQYLGKSDAKGLIYLGNRADESSYRMKSSLVSAGVKHKSQVQANGIINWNSLEVFLYLMMNGIEMNPAYREGSLRIGCLLCPRANTLGLGFSYAIDPSGSKPYYDLVRETYRESFDSEAALDEYINLGEWRFRRDSKGTRYHIDYRETIRNDRLHIAFVRPATAWETWIKTIGVVESTERMEGTPEVTRYTLRRGAQRYAFDVARDAEAYDVNITAGCGEEFIRLFKTVFRRAAACIGCRTCEVNCPHDHLRFVDNRPVIDDGCLHCAQCHSDVHGCLVFDSWFESDKVL